MKSLAHRLLTLILGKPEEVNGAERCPTYLYRWVLLRTPFGNLYIHHFVGDDWAVDLHDHPKHNLSLGWWGSYRDITETGTRVYRAPFLRYFPAEHRHRISATNCWTLLLVSAPVKGWGFYPDGKFVPWDTYVADPKRKGSCD